MKMSVVMATYNGLPFIKAQLESLLSQTRLPDELVISDDRSSDGTLDFARELLAGAPFPTFFTQNTSVRGYSPNFVCAARKSEGDVILFCDQDDIWAPNKIHVMEREFVSNPAVDCITHDFSVRNLNAPPIPSYFDYLSESGIEPHSCVKGCATAVRRRFVEAEDWLITGEWSYDIWVCWFSALLKRRAILNEVLIEHRIHETNTSGYIYPRSNLIKKLFREVRRRTLPQTTSNETVVRKALSLDQLNDLETHLQNRHGRQLGDDLSDILEFIVRRRPLLEFRRGPNYRHVPRRIIASLEHAFNGAYVADEIVFSLFKDMLGKYGDEPESNAAVSKLKQPDPGATPGCRE